MAVPSFKWLSGIKNKPNHSLIKNEITIIMNWCHTVVLHWLQPLESYMALVFLYIVTNIKGTIMRLVKKIKAGN